MVTHAEQPCGSAIRRKGGNRLPAPGSPHSSRIVAKLRVRKNLLETVSDNLYSFFREYRRISSSFLDRKSAKTLFRPFGRCAPQCAAVDSVCSGSLCKHWLKRDFTVSPIRRNPGDPRVFPKGGRGCCANPSSAPKQLSVPQHQRIPYNSGTDLGYIYDRRVFA